MATVSELKPWILALVGGIILLIIGAVTGTISLAVSGFIISSLNSTSQFTIPSNQNFVNQIPGIVSPIFSIIGTALVIVSLVFIIKQLLSIPEIAGE